MDIPDVGALDAPPGVGEGQGLPDSTYDCFTLLPADQLGKQSMPESANLRYWIEFMVWIG